MKLLSFTQPIPYYSYQEKSWFVVCSSDGSGWVKVDRQYTQNEIAAAWEKLVYYKEELKTKREKRSWFVDGSKGKKYQVTVDEDSVWSCSCAAFGFGRGKHCKHIQKLI